MLLCGFPPRNQLTWEKLSLRERATSMKKIRFCCRISGKDSEGPSDVKRSALHATFCHLQEIQTFISVLFFPWWDFSLSPLRSLLADAEDEYFSYEQALRHGFAEEGGQFREKPQAVQCRILVQKIMTLQRNFFLQGDTIAMVELTDLSEELNRDFIRVWAQITKRCSFHSIL